MSNKRIHVVRKGDLAPDLEITVRDQDGVAVNLTSATVTFTMANSQTGVAKVVAQAATLVVAASGTVKYAWAGTDTDTAAKYDAIFRVTPASGDPYTVPTRGSITVVVK